MANCFSKCIKLYIFTAKKKNEKKKICVSPTVSYLKFSEPLPETHFRALRDILIIFGKLIRCHILEWMPPDSYLIFLHCITFKGGPFLRDTFYYSLEDFISGEDSVRYVQICCYHLLHV